MTDEIEFRPATTTTSNSNMTNTTSSLLPRDSIDWGRDGTPQQACDAKSVAEQSGGSEILKSDCQDIINNNIFWGRWTIRGYTSGRWAMINARGTCSLSVARVDGSSNPFE